ncbi:MAG TPA: GrpB family protein [Candidatus Dormibacteraeota bacterium]
MGSHESAFAEWRKLREARGPEISIIDLYELVSRPRGLEPHELPAGERDQLARRALPVLFPGHETLPDTNRPLDPVELVPYDADWPSRFRRWQGRLQEALDPAPLRIDHIGSTAVPGMAAKPIIDIQVSVRDFRDEPSYAPAIESLGVQLRSRDHEHLFFRPFAGRPRDVQIHVTTVGSTWERRPLLFVSYLRANPEARERYAAAKQMAASRWSDDRLAYMDAKRAVIDGIMSAAEAWAERTGWNV